jgi:hypothetical protein
MTFWNPFKRAEEPETVSTEVTEKYSYDSVEEVPFSGSRYAFEMAMQSLVETLDATLIHEQDGSITAVSPQGEKATFYYQPRQ